MRAQREAAERALVETHRATLKSAQSQYEAAVKAALADKDRARLLQAQKQALQRVLRVLRRWLRESLAGSFVWWRRAVTQVLEGQDLTAVRLLERTVARIGRPRGVFFCLLATGCEARKEATGGSPRVRPKPTRVESELGGRFKALGECCAEHASRGRGEGPRRALAVAGFASHGAGRQKQDHLFGGSVWCSMRASDEARVHAANLFSQALTRLAHKHTGGCFMV